MGDELFLRSRCSAGAGCHCSGMEHFYVPDSTDRPAATSSRVRRTSSGVDSGVHTGIVHSVSDGGRTTSTVAGVSSAAQADCAVTQPTSVSGQTSGGRVRSRRTRRSARGQPAGGAAAAAGDSSQSFDLSYLAYSSDEEFEEFIKQPRTDYTYSRSLSYTAVSPERVGPPSMSRLGLHQSPGHAAGDSPLLGSGAGGARRGGSVLGEGLGHLTAADCRRQGVYESTSTRVYNYRREITSHISSSSLLSNGGTLYGISPGLDADSQDEEWLPADGAAETAATAGRRLHDGWSVRRGAGRLFWPLVYLYLLVTAVCRRLGAAARHLIWVPVTAGSAAPTPVRTAMAASGAAPSSVTTPAAGRTSGGGSSSRPVSRARHRYQLRPRVTPQRETPLPSSRPDRRHGEQLQYTTLSPGSRPASPPAAPHAGEETGRLLTALGWLTAVLWCLNPLRWTAAIAAPVISRARTVAEVLDLPRGAATVAAAVSPAVWLRAVRRKIPGSPEPGDRPSWLRAVTALLWSPVGAEAGPSGSLLTGVGCGPDGEPSRWPGSVLGGVDGGAGGQSGAPLADRRWNGNVTAGGAEKLAPSPPGSGRRSCGPLKAAGLLLLLLLLTLLLLPPLVVWLGQEGGGAPPKHGQLSVGWWLLPKLEPAIQQLARGLSTLVGGLSSVGSLTVAVVQVLASQLTGAAGSAAAAVTAALWTSPATDPGVLPSAPELDPAPVAAVSTDGADARLSAALSQLADLTARVDSLQTEYQTCRTASERSSSPAAVRAALGLAAGSSGPVTAERLAAAELRLHQRLETELAALRAAADRQRTDADREGGVSALRARLDALEAALPAAEEEERRRAERTAAGRLDSLSEETDRLRADVEHLHRSLLAVQRELKKAGTCCNNTNPDWSSLLGTQIRQLEADLDHRIQLFTATLRQDLSSEVLSVSAGGGGGGGSGGGVSHEEAVDIALRELALYDADKTGKFDFALESAGGSIVSTKCTEAYTVRSAQLTVLGIPLWYPVNSPRAIIQPHVQPGECFAFHGEGQFVVGLSRSVRPTEFVVEHIARGLTPGQNIDSAPRHCSVLGLGGPDAPPVPLAEFEYDAAGPPLQRFAAELTGRSFSAVELRVTSNWGHPEYTCLYRFRVHGEPHPETEAAQEPAAEVAGVGR